MSSRGSDQSPLLWAFKNLRPTVQAGVTQLRHFRPPMPQEWQLRASQLYGHIGVCFHAVHH